MVGASNIWVWINTYENSIFRGMNIHKSQLFWCELQGYYWFWHTAIWLYVQAQLGWSPLHFFFERVFETTNQKDHWYHVGVQKMKPGAHRISVVVGITSSIIQFCDALIFNHLINPEVLSMSWDNFSGGESFWLSQEVWICVPNFLLAMSTLVCCLNFQFSFVVI